MTILISFLYFFFASPGWSVTIVGTDKGGADLIPNNGDTLSGTFTNVGLFQIGSGITVFVAPGSPPNPLVMYASTISISGTLDGFSLGGEPGGKGGQISSPGVSGSGGCTSPISSCPTNNGGGTGGASVGGSFPKGGGGGGGGSTGGAGAGDSGGGIGAPGGGVYGSTGIVSSPISSDDLFLGSGGGGGAGNLSTVGGDGAVGGGAIYLEASSITISGSILVDGSTAPPVAVLTISTPLAAGGGGGGGTVLIRAPGVLNFFSGSRVSANGGGGGNVSTLSSIPLEPGGGGAGGRIKIFNRPGGTFSVTLSTNGGAAGGKAGFSGTVDASTPPAAGANGTTSFGVIAASPSAFAVQTVYITSITWQWTATPDFGDAGAASRSYHVFPATATAPFSSPSARPEFTAIAAATNATVMGLTPNTTYFRFVTAFTDWGDSLPSNGVSTHTLANVPAAGAPAFTGMLDTGLTFNWTAGSPANPSYTLYELDRSTDPNFGVNVSTGFAVGLSSSPAGLVPNTTYFFRIRAVNIDGIPTTFAAATSTATLASVPNNLSFSAVNITSIAFTWSGGANPNDTMYTAEISTDNFLSLAQASRTTGTTIIFSNLDPGKQYFVHAAAFNRNGIESAFSTVISTVSAGAFQSNTSPPTAPGTPQWDRKFSYDGTATLSWSAAQSPIGILDYNLLVGSTPGGNDLFSGSTTTLNFAVTGMTSGHTYYAEVRARSNAGTFGSFSDISAGLPTFVTTQAAAISKAYNWPNPFDPAQGPTQIGFSLGEAASVVIRIYTLQGGLVHEESRQISGTGNQVVPWSGNNDLGRMVAPGGYIVRIEKRYSGHTDVEKFKIAVLY